MAELFISLIFVIVTLINERMEYAEADRIYAEQKKRDEEWMSENGYKYDYEKGRFVKLRTN